MLTPFERYHAALASHNFLSDEAQAGVVDHLQHLYQQLLEASQRWFCTRTIKGLYLWGSVGSGKTWLMDLFYDSLPMKQKWRSHFHEFIQEVQEQLQQYQGQANPLEKIAQHFARQTKVLCFDEFFVDDIGDAMILANLLDALFKKNLVMVATSNVAPDNLYKDGLQRGRFIPAINLLKKHCQIVALQTGHDYRLRELTQAGVFLHPITADTTQQLQVLFTQLAHGDIRYQKDLWLYDRPITTVAVAENILWVDFDKLCSVPRSQMDYLAIAKRYRHVIVSNLRQIKEDETSMAQYLINLVDIFYDNHVALIFSSHVPIDDLYPAGELNFAFQRTRSRLVEMQSAAYLAQTRA